MFDLDGFKAYNDTYGHATGDALLKRLGDKLAATMAGRGQSYRMGGDEFCVLATVAAHEAPETVDCAAQALSDHGHGFEVGASCGLVLLPDEHAADPSSALRIADRRMYAQKNLGRASAGRQTVDVLLKVLSERSAELGVHLHDVTGLCRAVAERLQLSAEDIGPLLQAASLHDIGKAAIPDSILDKPGPLNADDWSFMCTHTVIGSASWRRAGADRGRPAGAFESRALGRHGIPGPPQGRSDPARRAHHRGLRRVRRDGLHPGLPVAHEQEVALEELRRCAGTQFDGMIVEAFCAVVEERAPAER